MGSTWDFSDKMDDEEERERNKAVLKKPKEELHMPYVISQLEILQRIAVRGRNHCFKTKDSRGIDSFQHFEDEMERLRKYIEERA